jgi:signal transduction histidine kinase
MLLRDPYRSVRVDDYAAEPGPMFTREQYGVGSSVSVTIIVDDELWGVLGVITSGHRLPEETEERLRQFAELVAAALANSQARAKVRQLADEQTALRRVAELVARGSQLNEVFTAIVTEASVLLGNAATSLTRFEPDGFTTTLAVCNSAVPPGLRVPSDMDTAASRAFRSGRPARLSFTGTAAAELAAKYGVVDAVAVPIIVEGQVWATLSTNTPGPPPPAGTEERLEEFAALAAAAIANAENKASLTASRARVVATADETRRRLQRDVHDGAQQRLVQTVITLQLARDAVAHGRPPAGLIDEALYHAERANSELRDLVHGILPASLSRGGLRTGLESLIADIPAPVHLQFAAPRLASETETTAYFIVAEALTNVVKHANATRTDVRIKVRDGVVEIEISDNGIGGADAVRGTGLTGLSDRVAAAEGTLTIASPVGGGTTLRACLPVAPTTE